MLLSYILLKNISKGFILFSIIRYRHSLVYTSIRSYIQFWEEALVKHSGDINLIYLSLI